MMAPQAAFFKCYQDLDHSFGIVDENNHIKINQHSEWDGLLKRCDWVKYCSLVSLRPRSNQQLQLKPSNDQATNATMPNIQHLNVKQIQS